MSEGIPVPGNWVMTDRLFNKRDSAQGMEPGLLFPPMTGDGDGRVAELAAPWRLLVAAWAGGAGSKERAQCIQPMFAELFLPTLFSCLFCLV